MSARSYYLDSYLTQFSSAVLETGDLGGRPYLVLERSAFYPTSGGQPHDTGTLNGVAVLDVTVREDDGQVLHLLETPITSPSVEGVIDWTRRFDHMQQHTGQHVLSQAFIRVMDAITIGFHLGGEYVSIDLDASAITRDQANRAFEIANEAIESNLPIRAWFPSPDELATIPLRKTPDVDGALRVVAIGDFDFSACGGTHVARTGELGLIQHLRSEKLKRGTRIAFLVGRRARADYAAKHAITQQLAAELTCSVAELPDTLTRLRDELQESRRENARHRAEALGREALQLRKQATTSGGVAVVVAGFEGRTPEEIRTLVLELTAAEGTVALLGTAGAKAQFVFGRSEDLATDLRPALNAALAAIGGGKGGGSRIVQGGGARPATLAEVETALEAGRAAIAR